MKSALPAPGEPTARTLMLRTLLAPVLLCSLSACAPRSQVEGTVQGVTFQHPQAISSIQVHLAGGGRSFLVLLSDAADPCAHLLPPLGTHSAVALADGGTDPTQLFLSMEETVQTDAGAVSQPGRRVVGESMEADLSGGALVATAGSATFSNSSLNPFSENLAGDFQLSFGDAGSLQGTFQAKHCDELSAVGCAGGGRGLGLAPLLALALWLRPRRSR